MCICTHGSWNKQHICTNPKQQAACKRLSTTTRTNQATGRTREHACVLCSLMYLIFIYFMNPLRFQYNRSTWYSHAKCLRIGNPPGENDSNGSKRGMNTSVAECTNSGGGKTWKEIVWDKRRSSIWAHARRLYSLFCLSLAVTRWLNIYYMHICVLLMLYAYYAWFLAHHKNQTNIA